MDEGWQLQVLSVVWLFFSAVAVMHPRKLTSNIVSLRCGRTVCNILSMLLIHFMNLIILRKSARHICRKSLSSSAVTKNYELWKDAIVLVRFDASMGKKRLKLLNVVCYIPDIMRNTAGRPCRMARISSVKYSLTFLLKTNMLGLLIVARYIPDVSKNTASRPFIMVRSSVGKNWCLYEKQTYRNLCTCRFTCLMSYVRNAWRQTVCTCVGLFEYTSMSPWEINKHRLKLIQVAHYVPDV